VVAATDLHGWTDGRLLHGDLEGGHIFVADDHYRGMIDFDQAQVGDPRWDLARVPLWDGDAALDALLDGYGRDTIGPGDRDLLLPLYLLAFMIRHAVQLTDQGQLSDARAHLAKTRYERLL
jgi:aminoglycoside phosphotransferase (APT) family kinase protein